VTAAILSQPEERLQYPGTDLSFHIQSWHDMVHEIYIVKLKEMQPRILTGPIFSSSNRSEQDVSNATKVHPEVSKGGVPQNTYSHFRLAFHVTPAVTPRIDYSIATLG
jgi:hypothetical protein